MTIDANATSLSVPLLVYFPPLVYSERPYSVTSLTRSTACSRTY